MSRSSPTRLALRPSRHLAGWLSVVHAAALVPLWSTGIPLPIVSVLSICVACHAVWAVWRHALLGAPASAAAVELSGRECAITLRDGRVLRGRVADNSVVIGWLVILAVKRQSWRPPARIAVVSDMCAPEPFRQLRVALRWVGAEPSRSDTSNAV